MKKHALLLAAFIGSCAPATIFASLPADRTAYITVCNKSSQALQAKYSGMANMEWKGGWDFKIPPKTCSKEVTVKALPKEEYGEAHLSVALIPPEGARLSFSVHVVENPYYGYVIKPADMHGCALSYGNSEKHAIITCE